MIALKQQIQPLQQQQQQLSPEILSQPPQQQQPSPQQWQSPQAQQSPQTPQQVQARQVAAEVVQREHIHLRSTSNARFLNNFVPEKLRVPVVEEDSDSEEEVGECLHGGSSGEEEEEEYTYSSGEEEEEEDDLDDLSSGDEEANAEYDQYRRLHHDLLEARAQQKLARKSVRRSVRQFKVSQPHTNRNSHFVIAPKGKILRSGMEAFRNCQNGIVSLMREDLSSDDVNFCFCCGKRFGAETKLFLTHSKKQKTGFMELDDANTGHYIQHLAATDMRHNYQGHEECYIYRVVRFCVRCFNQYNNNMEQDKQIGRVTIVRLTPIATTLFLMPEGEDPYQ